MNEVATTSGLAGIPIGPRGLQMRSAGDLMMFIRTLCACGMAPDNKGENDLLIRAHYGMSLGLDPMRAVQSIYVVRNRPCVWGAAIPGLILASGKCKRWEVSIVGEPNTESYGVQVITERHDISGVNTFQFTMADARRANLLGKDTWKSYPADMMRWKAIGRAASSIFGDILYGLSIVENERDIEDAEVIEDAPTIAVAEVVPEPAPAAHQHPPELQTKFAEACAHAGVDTAAEVAALKSQAGVTSWHAVPEAEITARWAELMTPVTAPTPTASHPLYLRLVTACERRGMDPRAEFAAMMTAADCVEAAEMFGAKKATFEMALRHIELSPTMPAAVGFEC